jgi:hypothetical protein
MDEVVQRAIAKWPNVPAVFGWLSLDCRGNWSIKGEGIHNPVITDFIGRNYACDQQGRWFFQNGPQKVFVTLKYTPWILRTQGVDSMGLVTHTGTAVSVPRTAWVDEEGQMLIEFGTHVGLVHDHDLAALASCICDHQCRPLPDSALETLLSGSIVPGGVCLQLASGSIPLRTICKDQVPSRFGFDPDPRPAPGEPDC